MTPSSALATMRGHGFHEEDCMSPQKEQPPFGIGSGALVIQLDMEPVVAPRSMSAQPWPECHGHGRVQPARKPDPAVAPTEWPVLPFEAEEYNGLWSTRTKWGQTAFTASTTVVRAGSLSALNLS